MALSSIKNYDSEDFSEEDEAEDNPICSLQNVKRKSEEETPSENPGNFFATASGNSSDSDSDVSNDGETDTNSNRPQFDSNKVKLPSALSVLNAAGSDDPSKMSAIFSNPFKQAEEAEFNLLQQHVKLSDRKAVVKPIKKSRLACKMFKKGRCKLGDECRFSHVVGAALMARLTEPSEDGNSVSDVSAAPSVFESNPVKYNAREEVVDTFDTDEAPKRKKRKVGVTDSLVPPKKALQLFDDQMKKESPWSCSKS